MPDEAMPSDEAWGRLAREVRVRRKRLKLTQHELASAAGLSEPTVRVIETSRRRRYEPGTFEAVARALGWSDDSFDRILDGGEPMERVAAALRPSQFEAQDRFDTIERKLDHITSLLEAIYGGQSGVTVPPVPRSPERQRATAAADRATADQHRQDEAEHRPEAG